MIRALVIMPTYNEAGNLPRVIPAVLAQHPDFHVLIVDDGSPDGTAALVRAMQAGNPRVHLLERPGKQGLGTAYVAGFRYALARGYDFVFEMDADFSHDPAMLPALLKKTEDCDLVIGSRYVPGGRVQNWPLSRWLLSCAANLYTRLVTGLPVHDATAGFKCYRRAVLESFDLDAIRSNGYSFQIETNFLAWKAGFRIGEAPILFGQRQEGRSKMSRRIVWEALWMVWKLRLRSLGADRHRS
jgi:dolichol-phosphate mannosyltransferase